MMQFEDIRAEFNWVVDELNDGMTFFEGYILYGEMRQQLDGTL